MIYNLDDLIERLTEIRKEHGNIEVECIGFEGDVPIEEVTVERVGDKNICRIKEIA